MEKFGGGGESCLKPDIIFNIFFYVKLKLATYMVLATNQLEKSA